MVTAGGTAIRTAAAVQMAGKDWINSANLDELDWKLDLKGLAEMRSPVHFDRHSHVNSADFTTIIETFKRKPNANAT